MIKKTNKQKVSTLKFCCFLMCFPDISMYPGKTTLTEALRESLKAALLKSPPQCLAPFRQRFDSEPPLIRRAFYALGNYITAAQIGKESLRAPVIVDR